MGSDSVVFDKWLLPKGEQHLQAWMWNVQQRKHGRLTYQAGKYDAAIKYCKQKRHALDIGAHVGLWSFLMAHDFGRVTAFEPHPLHARLWRDNMRGYTNTIIFETALGENPAHVDLQNYTQGSSGDMRIRPDSAGEIPMQRLDDILPMVADVDFIKMDCEGYEFPVLLGAGALLERCKPVVIVEQKPGKAACYGLEDTQAVKLLEAHGYKLAEHISGDYVMVA